MGLFLYSLSCTIDLFIYHDVSNTLYWLLKHGKSWSQVVYVFNFILFKVLAIVWPLHFHMEFQNLVVNFYKKKPCWHFGWDSVDSVDQFGKNFAVLTVLSSSAHGHHLAIYWSLLSLSRVLKFSACRSGTSSVKFIPKCFMFFMLLLMVLKKIFFFFSFWLLLIHRNIIDFGILMFYPAFLAK